MKKVNMLLSPTATITLEKKFNDIFLLELIWSNFKLSLFISYVRNICDIIAKNLFVPSSHPTPSCS